MSFNADETLGIILPRLCKSMSYDKAASLGGLFISDLRHMQNIVDCIHECGRKPIILFIDHRINIYDVENYCCYNGNIYTHMLTNIDDVLSTIKKSEKVDVGTYKESTMESAFMTAVPYFYQSGLAFSYQPSRKYIDESLSIYSNNGTGECIWCSYKVGDEAKDIVSDLMYICKHIDEFSYQVTQRMLHNTIEEF